MAENTRNLLKIARDYQKAHDGGSWGCSNGEAVAYAHLIAGECRPAFAERLAPRVGQDLYRRYGVMRGTLCPQCGMGRNCDC